MAKLCDIGHRLKPVIRFMYSFQSTFYSEVTKKMDDWNKVSNSRKSSLKKIKVVICLLISLGYKSFTRNEVIGPVVLQLLGK